ncbi:lipopolysaccharide biosynthesis protein [Bhargavaea cecembensis]|nr:oligosaccharide flippase family protein [Bhargavaea cecembensis]
MNKLLSKFLTYFLGSGLALIVGAITTIISTRIFPPTDFGKFSMFTLAVNLIMILIIFGTDQAFVRFYYEEEEKNRTTLFINTLKMPVILTVFFVFFIIIFKEKISLLLFGEIEEQVVWILIISILFQVLFRFALLVIRMEQKGILYSIVTVVNRSLNLLLIILFIIFFTADYKLLIYAFSFALILATFLAIFKEKAFWCKSLLKHSKIALHSQKEILIYSFPLMITILITWLFQSFDRFAIRYWANFEELGIYTAAFQIVALLKVIESAFTTFWAPVSFQRFQDSPLDFNFFSKISKALAFVLFFIAIIIILLKDLIIFLLGVDYNAAKVVIPFLVFMPIMYTLSETTVIGINFYKKTHWHILIALISCVFNIIGNALLVPDFGAVGAAISTGLSYIVFFSLRTHISLRYYKVDFGLKKVYFFIGLLTVFALVNIIWPLELFTYIFGVILIFMLCMFYKKEIVFIFGLINKKSNNI